MNLGCVKFEEVIAQGTIVVKQTMFAEKAAWKNLLLSEVPDYFQSFDPKKIRSGETALYMQPYIIYYKAPLYLPGLDVEHPQKHHNSTQANINVAQELYYKLDTLNMTGGLVIGLSGKAFRFIWPWIVPFEYSAAFLEMVKDKKRFPGIDAGPQTGTNKFLRMFAYRGNNKQGHPAFNVHIHYLEQAAEILSLDPAKYQRLVYGPPNVDTYFKDIKRIIPKAMAPPEVIRIFDEYVFKLKIGSTIAVPGRPHISHFRGVNWDRIYSYLEEEGITYQKHEYETTDIFKLDTCPSCGEKEGNPYVTPGGRLKCFRSNKCEAGQDGKGLAPSKWVPRYTQPESEEEDIEVPGMDLAEARASLSQAIQTTDDIVINASPGVGKTYAALQHFVLLAKDKLILYTAPTHKLGWEAYEKVHSRDAGINIKYIKGRDEENCTDLGSVGYAASRGYFPARTVCLICKDGKTCGYKAQFEDLPEAGMIFSSHAMARYLVSRISPEVWIIDENPLAEFFEKKEIPQIEMDEFMLTEPGDIQPLFKEVRKVALSTAAQLKADQIGKLFVGDVPPGNWENATILEDISPIVARFFELSLYPAASSEIYTEIENPAMWEYANYKKGMNLKCTRWWDNVIKRDPAMSLYIKVEKPKGRLEITYTSTILDPPVFPDCQIVHLDGTVYDPEIPELFPGEVKKIDAQAHLNDTGKVHIMISRGKFKLRKLDDEQKRKDLEMLTGHLRQQDKKVLLITYKEQEADFLEAARELRPDLTFEVIHFWGPRGINAYEDFDACLVYGTPTVSPEGVEDQAAALFSEQEDMDRWKASLGRRDLTQAIHRIRPVNGGKNIVVMGSYWPTEYLGHPDVKIDLMRKGSNVAEAKKRLTDFAREHGFIDKPVANILGVGTKTDKNAVEAWQTRLSEAQGGLSDRVSTLIRILFKSGYPVEGTPPAIYLPKKGQWNNMLSQIREETGLPVLGTYKAPGRGGQSMVLGTVEKMAAFYESIGSALDLDLYDME